MIWPRGHLVVFHPTLHHLVSCIMLCSTASYIILYFSTVSFCMVFHQSNRFDLIILIIVLHLIWFDLIWFDDVSFNLILRLMIFCITVWWCLCVCQCVWYDIHVSYVNISSNSMINNISVDGIILVWLDTALCRCSARSFGDSTTAYRERSWCRSSGLCK